MAWSIGDLMLDPGNPKMRKSCNDVTKRCKPKHGDAENHWSCERIRLMEYFCKFHCRPVPIFEGNSFTANFNLVCSVHHLQYNQFLLTFQCQSTSQCQLMGWITSITISASSMVALVISIFLSILQCLARGQHRHVLLKSEWWPSSVEQLRLTTNRFEILATVKLTVVDINIPSTRKIGILSRNEFQTLCTFVNVTHFCIALLSNVVLVVVCVVAVVCKSPLEMAIASLLQD